MDTRSLPRPVTAAPAAVAAGLLIAGSILPLTVTAHFARGVRDQQMVVTSWTRTFDPPPQGDLALAYSAGHVPYFGLPIAVTAAALLGAAVAALRSPAAARIALVAAAAAAVAVARRGRLHAGDGGPGGAELLEPRGRQRRLADRLRDRPGFWVVVGGAVVALVAGALAVAQPRSPSSDATPPMGFPSTVIHQLPPEQGSPPTWS
ncbi:hypothetical protein [Amycolatopsis alkalitolerans]|uniref:Uncharacterized protein n=1 Tax=Amycolatopsis alkalitolerans TaxID=2547244 RepID=A0A5C4M8R9_9PSEU|nr:hypothetical protein [Amycolatopsis alkalitolerans]TNC29008.1 hypothetical protein FG385_02535 [Amycolatopsis alkalitolerans]